MKLRIGLTVAAVTLLGSLGSATAQGNFVFNGRFDAGVTGWTPFNVAGSGWDSSKGNPGGCFVLSGTSNPTTSQTINGLTPGVTYTISGDYQSLGAPVGDGFGVSVNGTSYFYKGSVSAWQSFSFAFTPSSSIATLSLFSEANGTLDHYRIDNISMQAVPEPSSLCLIAVASVLFFTRRKISPNRKSKPH